VSKKPVQPHEAARRDVEAAVDYYAREAGADVATGFIDALQAAYHLLATILRPDHLAMPMNLAFPGCVITSMCGVCSIPIKTSLCGCENPKAD
jgi:toxin ParE1/3/4